MLFRMHSDKENLASWEGADSPTHVSVSVLENEHKLADSVMTPGTLTRTLSVPLRGYWGWHWHKSQPPGKLETGSCHGVEEAVGGA